MIITEGLFMKYFVLSPLKNTPYGKASRDALLEYAMSIQKHDRQLSHELNDWLYNINQKLDQDNPNPISSEAAEDDKTPQDMSSAVENDKPPKFEELGSQMIGYKTDGNYENAPEICPICKKSNIAFLDHDDGICPQWECHDCGEIFYDEHYGKDTPCQG